MGDHRDKFIFPAVGVLEGLFQLPLLGDVGVGPEPSHNVPLVVPDRQCPRQEPAIFAILAAQGKRVLPYFAGVPRVLASAIQASCDMLSARVRNFSSLARKSASACLCSVTSRVTARTRSTLPSGPSSGTSRLELLRGPSGASNVNSREA